MASEISRYKWDTSCVPHLCGGCGDYQWQEFNLLEAFERHIPVRHQMTSEIRWIASRALQFGASLLPALYLHGPVEILKPLFHLEKKIFLSLLSRYVPGTWYMTWYLGQYTNMPQDMSYFLSLLLRHVPGTLVSTPTCSKTCPTSSK